MHRNHLNAIIIWTASTLASEAKTMPLHHTCFASCFCFLFKYLPQLQFLVQRRGKKTTCRLQVWFSTMQTKWVFCGANTELGMLFMCRFPSVPATPLSGEEQMKNDREVRVVLRWKCPLSFGASLWGNAEEEQTKVELGCLSVTWLHTNLSVLHFGKSQMLQQQQMLYFNMDFTHSEIVMCAD